MRTCRTASHRTGFTLVELLVAIAVLAIVAVLGWRGLDGILRSRQALTAQMEQTRGIQLAFAQLQSDLEKLVGGAVLGTRPRLLADASRLTFVRTVASETEASRLQVVSYRIRDGVLARQESAATRELTELDQLWQASVSDAVARPGIALQANVAAMTVRVWQNGAWVPASGDAVTGSGTGAPTGLEMALQLQDQATSLTKAFLLEAQ